MLGTYASWAFPAILLLLRLPLLSRPLTSLDCDLLADAVSDRFNNLESTWKNDAIQLDIGPILTAHPENMQWDDYIPTSTLLDSRTISFHSLLMLELPWLVDFAKSTMQQQLAQMSIKGTSTAPWGDKMRGNPRSDRIDGNDRDKRSRSRDGSKRERNRRGRKYRDEDYGSGYGRRRNFTPEPERKKAPLKTPPSKTADSPNKRNENVLQVNLQGAKVVKKVVTKFFYGTKQCKKLLQTADRELKRLQKDCDNFMGETSEVPVSKAFICVDSTAAHSEDIDQRKLDIDKFKSYDRRTKLNEFIKNEFYNLSGVALLYENGYTMVRSSLSGTELDGKYWSKLLMFDLDAALDLLENLIRVGDQPASITYGLKYYKPEHLANDGIKNMIGFPKRQDPEFERKAVWIACEQAHVCDEGVEVFNALQSAKQCITFLGVTLDDTVRLHFQVDPRFTPDRFVLLEKNSADKMPVAQAESLARFQAGTPTPQDLESLQIIYKQYNFKTIENGASLYNELVSPLSIILDDSLALGSIYALITAGHISTENWLTAQTGKSGFAVASKDSWVRLAEKQNMTDI